jgi:hypothetical protein
MTRARTWVRRHLLAIVATVALVAFLAFMLVTTVRIYDERQQRLDAVERLAEVAEQLGRSHCEGINETNATVRFILDAGLRLRSASNPLSPELRAAYVEAYKRLPLTDCATGVRTFFDPPFPSA